MISLLKALLIVAAIVIIGYMSYFVVIIGSIAIVIYGMSLLIKQVEN